MQKKTVSWVIVIFILIIMAITNPTKSEYVSWLKENAMNKSDGFLVKGVISLFGNSLFDASTSSKNFLFFTVFDTNIAGIKDATFIGLFHNFIPINLPKENSTPLNIPDSLTSESSTSSNSSVEEAGNQQSQHSSPTPSTLTPDPETNTQPNPDADKTPSPSVQTGGTVNVVGNTGTIVLPLIGVKAQYGIGNNEPSVIPDGHLPDIHFDIPTDEADRLAVYWINLGNSDNMHGMLNIAPKDWLVKNAGIGADGSTGFTLVSDSSTSPQTISYSSDGGCFGCAVDNIGAYFPDLKDWATKNAVVPETIKPLQYKSSVMLDHHTIAYTMQKTSETYETNGVAVENHVNNPIFFGNAEITSPDKELSTTVLNFYLQTLSQIRSDN